MSIHRTQLLPVCLFLLTSTLSFPTRAPAQPPTASAAALVVEIQCKPGTSELWRDRFEKEIVPSIRESIQKGDAFTSFTYFEAPLPAQNPDFILVFELKSFGSLDVRRVPPHYEALFRRLGPERATALLKEMGNWEQHVTVNLLRAYKVQP